MLDLTNRHDLYFIGIGGVGMSAAAGLCRAAGFRVSGSDSKEVYSPAREVLSETSIPYRTGYDGKALSAEHHDLYIISAGEDRSNPEVAAVYERGLPHCSFAELLGAVFRDQLRIVVAGTHGKSTTTGWLGHVLSNLDGSSFMAGGVLKQYGRNFSWGPGHYAVFEGDEYKSEFDDPTPKFQYYRPDILVLTNLEYDHPDLFGSFEDLEVEFDQLVAGLPEDGLLVYNGDDAALAKLAHRSHAATVSFGLEPGADFRISDVSYAEDYTSFEVKNRFSKDLAGQLLGLTESYRIQLPGEMNVRNAGAVVATLRALGFSYEQVSLDLLSYQGIKRRFEVVGTVSGRVLVDDYAHHPTAVSETLRAARQRYGTRRVWAIFEPHTFSRTKATLGALAESFRDADQVLISTIYPAREKLKDASVTSEEVVQAISQHHPNVRLVHSREEALGLLKAESREGDVIITMAVGSFNRLAYELLAKL